MFVLQVPPNKGYGSVEVSNGNFEMLGQGVRTLGPHFRPSAYNEKLINSVATTSSFLGMSYHLNDAAGEDCESLLEGLAGLEAGTAPSLALQGFYLSQMRLLGSWKDEPASLFQTFGERTGVITDGGVLDNSGIIGLLRQRIPNVLAVMGTNSPYSEVNSLGYLFGQNPWAQATTCFNFLPRLPDNTMQVFGNSLWPQVDAATRDSKGNNSITLRNVAVMANSYVGVEAYTIDTLYLQGQEVAKPLGSSTLSPFYVASFQRVCINDAGDQCFIAKPLGLTRPVLHS